MSLLWRNKQLRVGLAPDRIYITGAKSVDLAANDGSWNTPVEALAATLAGRKGEAAVVLADQFVRYALLPYNETLKTRASRAISMKVSEKGGVSIYGLGRFPVTLYKEQWAKLLDMADEIRAFLKDNDSKLKTKP